MVEWGDIPSETALLFSCCSGVGFIYQTSYNEMGKLHGHLLFEIRNLFVCLFCLIKRTDGYWLSQGNQMASDFFLISKSRLSEPTKIWLIFLI